MPVLVQGVLNSLSGHRVLELDRHDWNAIDTQYDVQGLFGSLREVQLPREPDAVGGVASFQLGV